MRDFLDQKLAETREKIFLGSTAQNLYRELMIIAESKGWKQEFACSNESLAKRIQTKSKNTMIEARKKLVKANLIIYRSEKENRKWGRYSFPGLPIPTPKDHSANIDRSGSINEQSYSKNEHNNMYNVTNNYNIYNIKEKINKKEKDEFEKFYELYPGIKRNMETELLNFVTIHKDHERVAPLLAPAVERMVEWREKRQQIRLLVPALSQMKSWINERHWENKYSNFYD